MATGDSSTLFVVGRDDDPDFADTLLFREVAMLRQELELAKSHASLMRVYQNLCSFRTHLNQILESRTKFAQGTVTVLHALFTDALESTKGLERIPMPDAEKAAQELRIAFMTGKARFQSNTITMEHRITPPDPQSSPGGL
ncbi:hypothetical protein K8942_02550 [Candidatus Peribacteria bacterium]|nr:MAG: hypothetical protein K8942_02550 [Candidatus Peribacteria bacterium]